MANQEVRVYSLDQGNKQGAIKVETYRSKVAAKRAEQEWTERGYLAITLPAGRVQSVLDKRNGG